MDNKTIDETFNNLSDEREKEYLQQFNYNCKITVGFIIAMPIAFIIMSVIRIVVYHADNFYSILSVAIFACIITIISIVAIMFVIKQLKWTDEKKIKKQIEIIEKRKEASSKDIKTDITYQPSNEENDIIFNLTNKFYLDFSNNIDLYNIIERNIDNIKTSLFDIELVCSPFQHKHIHRTDESPRRYLVPAEVYWEDSFLLPAIGIEPNSLYIDYIRAWDKETIKKVSEQLFETIAY